MIYRFFFIIIFIFLACNNRKDLIKYNIEFNDFPKNEFIDLEPIIEFDSTWESDKFLINNDKIFIINNNPSINNFLVHEFSLNTKTKVDSFVKIGSKEGMALTPMSFGIFREKFLWFHDLGLKKVSIIELDNYNTGNKNVFDFDLPFFSYSSKVIDTNLILLSGFPHSPYYLEIFDFFNQKSKQSLFDFLPPNEKLPLNSWKGAYEGFLFVTKSSTKAAIACRFTDVIKIFNLENNKKLFISGPENFKPEFTPLYLPETQFYTISRNKRTRFSYLGGDVTENFIYLLFSGKTERDEMWNKSNIVFVVDWNGKIIKKITLSNAVNNILISQDDKIIYGISQDKSQIFLGILTDGQDEVL